MRDADATKRGRDIAARSVRRVLRDYEPAALVISAVRLARRLAGDRLASLRMVEVKLDLPKLITAFVKAMNMYDTEAMVGTFAATAVVNDQQREHVGLDAVRRWVDKEIVGDKVTMYVTEAVQGPASYAVVAKITGAYDKTKLPDPLTLRFYFSLIDDHIAQLVVVPVKGDAA